MSQRRVIRTGEVPHLMRIGLIIVTAFFDRRNFMSLDLPELDKTVLSVSSLDDETEEMKYWLSKNPSERLEAIEINRRMVYGKDRTTSRLQRFLEVSELTKS